MILKVSPLFVLYESQNSFPENFNTFVQFTNPTGMWDAAFWTFFSTISMFLNVYYYNWTNICTSFVLNDKKDIMDIIWRGVGSYELPKLPNSKLQTPY